VQLLYKTACWQCDQPVEAGTTVWWDDDRRHATCLSCFPDRGDAVALDGVPTVLGPDLRTVRRLEVVRAGRPRHARFNRRTARRTVPRPSSPS
jgi:hypothetical protein